VRLTSGNYPDVVFWFAAGQLQYVCVVRLTANDARQVFRYGATRMAIRSTPTPVIEAASQSAQLIERFAWNPRLGRFLKVGSRATRAP
jgi:hypothetical protein